MHTEDLIEGCIKNRATCQQELYQVYAGKMLAVCYRFAHNRQDAEDMLQESFIKVFSQINTYKFEGSFEGWIRRIVVYTCINYLKKYRKLNDFVDIELVEDRQTESETSVSNMLQVKQIYNIIAQLPVGYKTVFNLFAFEGFSHKEIADILKIKESTSRSQYVRAKQFLEKELLQHGIISKQQEQMII